MVLETLQNLCEIDKCIKNHSDEVDSPCERFPDSWLTKKLKHSYKYKREKKHQPQTFF